MTEELLTPGVPVLSDEWIAQRTQHLVEEVSAPAPRRHRRLIVTGVGGGTLAVAAALVGLLGPWATPAFAGWSAQPTTPTSGQLSTAEIACAALATTLASAPGSTAPATLPSLSLSDVRGPYSLLVYGATTNPALCVLGNGVSVLHEDGATIGESAAANKADGNTVVQQSSGSENFVTNPSATTSLAPGAAVVNIDNTAVSNGQSFSVVEGSVGSQVSGATLLLSDGSSVVATVTNGCFAAWWPSQATVSSIQVTTTSGVN
jgi:hypothetical protein